MSAVEPPTRVELYGCAEWPDGACAVAHDTLTLWIADTAPEPLKVTIDGAEVAIHDVATPQGGARLQVSARPGTLKVAVPGRRPWHRRLVPFAASSALRAVAALRGDGDLDGADAQLAALTRTATVVGALGEAARNALARGEIGRARTLLEKSIAQNEAGNRPRAMLRDRTALAYLLSEYGYAPSLVRAQLDALRPLAGRHAEAAVDLDYSEAAFAAVMRTPGASLSVTARLLARAERLGLDDVALDAHQMRATALVLAGRWFDLLVALRPLREAVLMGALTGCKRAEVVTNLSWYRMSGHRQAPHLYPKLPVATLKAAATAWRKDCPRPLSVANAEVNLGWAAVFSDAFGEAQAHLEAARAVAKDLDLRSRLEHAQLQASIDLGRGNFERALRAFERLGRRAKQVELLTGQWHAAVGRGEALEGLGRLDEAIAAYRESERLRAALAERIPLGEGRDSLLFERRRGAERLIAALTKAGRGVEAIEAIRWASKGTLRWAELHARLLRSEFDAERGARQLRLREARSDLMEAVAAAWDLPEDAVSAERNAVMTRAARARMTFNRLMGQAPEARPLRAEAPGKNQAFVYAHPVDDGMIAWAHTSAGLFSTTATTAALARLQALAPALLTVREVFVYAHPTLAALDWGGWPLGGRPLFHRASVVQRADLPPVDAVAKSSATLVTADPSGNLPSASAEGRYVADWLRGRGHSVTHTSGPLDYERLRGLLSGPLAHWHYSGHGVQAGLDGLDSGLMLQDELRFAVPDVLALDRAPRRVVLAACELGRRGSRRGSPGFGLAHALLIAGAEEVVAATRLVDDDRAARWVRVFYRETTRSQTWAEAVRKARVELAVSDPQLDAAAFRVWSRK